VRVGLGRDGLRGLGPSGRGQERARQGYARQDQKHRELPAQSTGASFQLRDGSPFLETGASTLLRLGCRVRLRCREFRRFQPLSGQEMRKLAPLAAAAAAFVATPPAAAACTPGWSVAETIPRAQLRAVSVLPGKSGAWAVGVRRDDTGEDHPLAIRFDGRRWRRVPVPEPAGETFSFTGVFARSRSDVWAVGYRDSELGDGIRTLAAHWDGSRWAIIPGADPAFLDQEDGALLLDVVARNRGEAWMVGFSEASSTAPQVSTLVKHWGGSSLALFPSISPADWRNRLQSVAHVPGSGTLWSVGDFRNDSGSSGPLIERYRRGAWAQDTAPEVPGGALNAVTALRRDDVWAVGSSSSEDGSALTMHRSGGRWTQVASPPSPRAGGYSRLNGVSAVSARDVWAVGYLDGFRDVDSSGNIRGPLIQHWDGSAWSLAPVPLDDPTTVLYDVAMHRSGHGWSVGTSGLYSDALLLRHCPR
jgi:hypothetical protein